jgi:predicted DNA-binding antitoxin AbrB/MazE fold protein
MPTEFDAVYENGILKPLIALALENHKRYHFRLDDEVEPQADNQSQVNNAEPDPYRMREYAWLREHQAEFAGQYVALYGGQLVAHGTDGREVFRKARAAGFPRALMVQVEAADEPPFGGW